MQIKRVKTITKICKDNKQQNEESIRVSSNSIS